MAAIENWWALMAGLALAALFAPAAHAQTSADDSLPRFSFNAFGTFGVVHSSSDQVDFVRSVVPPHGVGFSDEWSTTVDSLAGLQGTWNASERLSAVVQVVSEYRYDNTYRPRVDFANLKYQFSPDVSLRIGRIQLPSFLWSDSRKVGYAHPWARPPVEFYDLIPYTSIDGVDFAWRQRLGEGTNTLELVVGQTDHPLSVGAVRYETRVHDEYSLTSTYERGNLTLHAAYVGSVLSTTAADPLIDALVLFGPEGAAAAYRLRAHGVRVSYFGLGAYYDPGRWFLMGEVSHEEGKGLVQTHQAGYVTAGLRFGRFSPYVTYASSRRPYAHEPPQLTTAAYPQQFAPVIAGLNSGIATALNVVGEQSTAGAGVRVELGRNVAMTLQYDHLMLPTGSLGVTLVNQQPGFQPGSSLNLLSLTVDFVL